MRRYLAVLLAVVGAASAVAQDAASSPASFTLHTTARSVLTDVVVLDGKGAPVRGLPQDAFHLFDDGKPQQFTSFEERRSGPDRPAILHVAPGVYTNDPARLPPVLDVVLIDLVHLDFADQMFLSTQLQRFIRGLPASNAALSIYLRAGMGCVLVTDFTEDRERLLSAVRRSLPQFPQLGSQYAFSSDSVVLQQIAGALHGLPGRKNVLWFTGQQDLLLDNPFAWGSAPTIDLRGAYDTLEAERIALYPVDARGLTIKPGSFTERSRMEQVAEATGGRAFYNTNGLAEAAAAVVSNDGDFYTLSYTPANFVENDKWHRIKVVVDGKHLHLSYRRGYFADDDHRQQPPADAVRTRLLSGGRTVREKPLERKEPLVFTATVAPAARTPGESPAPYTVRYVIRYSVKATGFQRSTVDGESRLQVGVGVAVTNRWGTPVTHTARKMEFSVDERRLSAVPDTPVQLEQTLDLPVGDDYLYLALWDPLGKRLGTLSLSQHVPGGNGK
jgi:VWFA-related protein